MVREGERQSRTYDEAWACYQGSLLHSLDHVGVNPFVSSCHTASVFRLPVCVPSRRKRKERQQPPGGSIPLARTMSCGCLQLGWGENATPTASRASAVGAGEGREGWVSYPYVPRR